MSGKDFRRPPGRAESDDPADLDARTIRLSLLGTPAFALIGLGAHALGSPGEALISALDDPIVAWATVAVGVVLEAVSLALVFPVLKRRAALLAERDWARRED